MAQTGYLFAPGLGELPDPEQSLATSAAKWAAAQSLEASDAGGRDYQGEEFSEKARAR